MDEMDALLIKNEHNWRENGGEAYQHLNTIEEKMEGRPHGLN